MDEEYEVEKLKKELTDIIENIDNVCVLKYFITFISAKLKTGN